MKLKVGLAQVTPLSPFLSFMCAARDLNMALIFAVTLPFLAQRATKSC